MRNAMLLAVMQKWMILGEKPHPPVTSAEGGNQPVRAAEDAEAPGHVVVLAGIGYRNRGEECVSSS